MPRRAAKVDANQREIVSALRRFGASVQHLHAVGAGCPDIICGYRGVNILFELKDGDKPPSKQRLTKDQEVWFDSWRGQAGVVRSPEEAIMTLQFEWGRYCEEMERENADNHHSREHR